MPITRIEQDTLYLEIREKCPLGGTGDFGACHRLMQYDRVLLDHIGAQRVVIRSQVEAGVSSCEVALRLPGQPLDALESVPTENPS